ncbi:unnamed protein product [Schistosoma margrebowiei]|uniref:Uncharacterized protein n=1 Tax=Schistosoma margrebowiei TaxID=48269 RepID=A0A183N594_9TREM|nr:unnamed protein product [Schistosoma margrebowiei]
MFPTLLVYRALSKAECIIRNNPSTKHITRLFHTIYFWIFHVTFFFQIVSSTEGNTLPH